MRIFSFNFYFKYSCLKRATLSKVLASTLLKTDIKFSAPWVYEAMATCYVTVSFRPL